MKHYLLLLAALAVWQPGFAQVVINELMVSPPPLQPGGEIVETNSMYTECVTENGRPGPTEAREWIELYNASLCDTVDLSCWMLAGNTQTVNLCVNGPNGRNYGVFTFPRGTRLGPREFLVIGSLPEADLRLPDYRAQGLFCSNVRWFLENGGASVLLLRADGGVADAVYWSGANAGEDAIRNESRYRNGFETNCTCDGAVREVPSPRDLYDQGLIAYAGAFDNELAENGRGQFLRAPDGGEWQTNVRTPTRGACNAQCAELPDLVAITPQNPVVCPGGARLVSASAVSEEFPVTELSFLWRNRRTGETYTTPTLNLRPEQTDEFVLETRYNDNCVDRDTVVVRVLARPSSNFTLDPEEVCPGDSATLTYEGVQYENAEYNWEFDGGGAAPGTGPGPQRVAWDVPGDKTVGLSVTHFDSVSSLRCVSDFTFRVVRVLLEPTADFTISPATICEGGDAQVRFAGQASNRAVFNWDFDGGAADPGVGRGPHRVRWENTGQATVSLTVQEPGACPPAEETQTITIRPSPTAAFSLTPNEICLGEFATATFTGSGADGASFEWEFGGGTAQPGTGAGPHQIRWDVPGLKTVELTMRTPGCPPSLARQTVRVSEGPEVELTAEPSAVCLPDPVVVRNTGATQAGDLITWDFGGADAAPGAGAGPQMLTWDAPGAKTVGLSVTRPGCPTQSDEIEIQVSEPPVASFEVAPAELCAGDTAELVFTGEAPDGAAFEWDFGSGRILSGSGRGPYRLTWDAAASEDVVLTVTAAGCPPETTERAVVAFPTPAPRIFADPEAVCAGLPVEITYEGEDLNGLSVAWSFDGAEVTGGGETGPYTATWATPGLKTVRAEAAAGPCPAEPVEAEVEVTAAPVAEFMLSPNEICVTESAELAFTGEAGDNAALEWNYGGANAQPLGQPEERRFELKWDAPGPKTVTLELEENGCADGPVSQTINVLPAPSAGIRISPQELCTGDTLIAQFEGRPETDAPDFSWQFDPPPADFSGEGAGPYRAVWDAPGAVSVTVVIEENGCPSEPATATAEVRFRPAAAFSLAEPVCAGRPAELAFTGDAGPDAVFDWSAEGAAAEPEDVRAPAPIVWNAAGEYAVRLQVTENGCSSAPSERTASVLPTPTADFTLTPAELCAGETGQIAFAGQAGPDAVFDWRAQGASFPAGDSARTFPVFWSEAGEYAAELVVEENGCVSDPQTRNVFVKPTPTADFVVEPAEFCRPDSAVATYTGQAGQAASFDWDFDGAAAEPGEGPGPHTLRWPSAGTYTVTLLAEENGCDAPPQTRTVRVKPVPTSEFTADNTLLCSGDSVTITYEGFAPEGATYNWIFEYDETNEPFPVRNLPFDPAGPYVLKYETSGPKSVSLQVVADGCSSAVAELTVRSVFLQAAFEAPAHVCEDSVLNVVFTGQAPESGARYRWDFDAGNGFPGIGPGPHRVRFDERGVQLLSLYLTAGACTSETVFQTTRVWPKPEVSVLAQPDSGGAPLPVQFTTESSSFVQQFAWNYGDGETDGSFPEPLHEFVREGVYFPTVTVYSAGGCEASARDTVIVEGRNVFVPNAFSPNNDGNNDLFQVFGLAGVDRLKFRVFDRWGVLIWETERPDEFWNGEKDGAPVPQGVYVYRLDYEDQRRDITKSGTVTLIR